MESDTQIQPGFQEPDNGQAASEAQTLLGQLADIRREIKDQAPPLHLEIPGYKGKLWGRFRPYSVAKSESKAQAVAKAVKQKKPVALETSCDTLIEACEQIMLLPPQFTDIGDEGEHLIPIASLPVKFDKRLAEALQVPAAADIQTARQVILAVFPTEQSVLRMSITINEWLNGELAQDTDEEFLGK